MDHFSAFYETCQARQHQRCSLLFTGGNSNICCWRFVIQFRQVSLAIIGTIIRFGIGYAALILAITVISGAELVSKPIRSLKLVIALNGIIIDSLPLKTK